MKCAYRHCTSRKLTYPSNDPTYCSKRCSLKHEYFKSQIRKGVNSSKKPTENSLTCRLCQFKILRMPKHLYNTHKITDKFNPKYVLEEPPKCKNPNCNNDVTLNAYNGGFSEYCSKQCWVTYSWTTKVGKNRAKAIKANWDTHTTNQKLSRLRGISGIDSNTIVNARKLSSSKAWKNKPEKEKAKLITMLLDRGWHNSKKAGRIPYRSNWELIYFKNLDKDHMVKEYLYESIPIPYNNGNNLYIPDLLIEYQNGQKVMVEIGAAVSAKRHKLIAAIEYCKAHNYKLVMITKSEIENYTTPINLPKFKINKIWKVRGLILPSKHVR